MPKGYIITRMTVTDPDQYAKYVAATKAAVEKYGAKPIIRGGRCEAVEGEGRPRNVVMEFDSYDTALAYYHSAEYQAAKALRENAGKGEVVVVEGA